MLSFDLPALKSISRWSGSNPGLAFGAQRCRLEDEPSRPSEPRRIFRLDREAERCFLSLVLWKAKVELCKTPLKAGGLIRRELLSPTLSCAWRLPSPSQSEVIKATRLRAGPTPTEPVLQSPLCSLGLNYLPLKAIRILILENTPNQPGLAIHQK